MLSGLCELPRIFCGRLSEHTQTVSHKAYSCVALTEITHATSVTGPLIGCQVTTYMHDKHVLCDGACVLPGAVYSSQNYVIWQLMMQWVWEMISRNLEWRCQVTGISYVSDISQEPLDAEKVYVAKWRQTWSFHALDSSDVFSSVWIQILVYC